MEIIIITTIRIIKKVTKGNVEENNLAENNKDKIGDYASILYDQALLIEGLSIEDPVAFSNKICELMIELNK